MPVDLVTQPSNPILSTQLMQLHQQISAMSYIMDCISNCLGNYSVLGTPLPGTDKMREVLGIQQQMNEHIINMYDIVNNFQVQLDSITDTAIVRSISKELVDELDKIIAKRSKDHEDFLVVEDKEMPTTWHLQVTRNGVPDHNLMGAAWAALHSGFRGNKYAGPKKREALSKLKALYKKEKLPLPSED